MQYKNLAQLYENLSSTTKRLEKIEILSKFLAHLHEDDKEVLYLLEGDIYPEYDERKIGISNQLAIKAISKATGTNEKKVTSEWKKIGDIGEVAKKLTQTKTQKTLSSQVITTKKVLDNLRKLTTLVGKGTVDKKLALITELLTSSSPIESQYLVRTLIGDLRIGTQESTIRESLSLAFFDKTKEASSAIQSAIDKSNDLVKVFDAAKKQNIKELNKIKLEVGKPIKAMLAQKAESMESAFKDLGTPLAVEYKYDGFRLIIHKNNNKITLYTRRLENVTAQFPEVKDYIKKYVKGKTLILDSEAVGYNLKTKKYKPFQDISQRIRRKYGIVELQKKLPIEVNVFDILYYEGKQILDMPFSKRTKLLRKIITNKPYKIICSKQIITDDIKKAKEFYKSALHAKQEGVMLKNLTAEYKPGRRVGHMLKIKPDVEDLDLVITGAEYGSGKRKGVMSSFILSCKNGNNYLEIGKMGTGIKEKQDEENKIGTTFYELTKKLTPYILKEKGKSVTIKPKIIVSVTYQEIQHSPNYNSGFALRFPRFVALREDKHLKEVTSLDEIKKDLTKQKRNWRFG